jgi:predicted anti-sigma-YlaC factor YlaD
VVLKKADKQIRKFEVGDYLREEAMHQEIRDNLEDYLKGSTHKVPQEFDRHLETCQECASELRLYQGQAEMLRLLQPGGDLDPRAGFYARVMEKIEQQDRGSIWSALLQPNFGRRLAMASAVLVMLLGTYFVASETSEPMVASSDVVFTGAPSASTAAEAGLQQQRQRDAVLVNLAAYHE